MEFLYAKSSDWGYENEYRIILGSKLMIKNPISIERNEIKEIIFGLRTSEKEKECILNLLKNCNPNVKIYQMIKIDKTYKLCKEFIGEADKV